MKRFLRKVNAFSKGLILWMRPGVYLGFLASPFLFVSNLLRLTRWISKQTNQDILNDFFVISRDYNRRYKLYEYVISKQGIASEAIEYFEFGVRGGESFRWWLHANKNPQSRFYGFDTFEGLPEDWGTYKKGDMAAGMPVVDDTRCQLVKGLFQDTLVPFLKWYESSGSTNRKVLHCDADLFSSTIFVLACFAPHLKSGDIIFFDEFNVPNHEFFACQVFTDSFYVKFELLGAVNNFFQVAFKVA